MKDKLLYSLLLILFSHHLVSAQSTEERGYSKSLVFIEAGGFGGYGSINYEHLLKNVNGVKLSARIGLSTYNLKDFSHKFNPDVIIPIAVNAYYGSKHNLDVSVGTTLSNVVHADNTSYEPSRKHSYNTNLSLGYRYQKEVGGTMFKVAYSPIIENNREFRNWFSLAIGYAF